MEQQPVESPTIAPMACSSRCPPLQNLLIDGLPVMHGLLLHDVGVTGPLENYPMIDGPPHQCGHPHHACVALIRTIDDLERN